MNIPTAKIEEEKKRFLAHLESCLIGEKQATAVLGDGLGQLLQELAAMESLGNDALESARVTRDSHIAGLQLAHVKVQKDRVYLAVLKCIPPGQEIPENLRQAMVKYALDKYEGCVNAALLYL